MDGQSAPSYKPAPGTQAAAFDMLMNAIGSLLSPVIQQLLNSDSGLVHLKGWHGMTPLHRACLVGDYNIVLMFIEANSDVNAVTDFQETPLHYASKRGFPAVVHLLIRCGAKVDCRDNRGRSALHHAAETGSVEVIKYFEETLGVNTREVDYDLQSLMHVVCRHGHMDLFSFLMSKGRSDLRQADAAGNLPVHISSEHGFGHITWSMLCVLGVSVLRQTNKAGYTPVDLVLQNDKPGHKELAPILQSFSHRPDSYRVSGPILKWYAWLLCPLLIYLACIVISQNLSSYQFVVFLLPAVLVFFQNIGFMDHRMDIISRWPNPIYAGLFGGGILHTVVCYFWVIYPLTDTIDLYTSWWITCLSWTVCPVLLLLYYQLLRQDPGALATSAKDPNTGKTLSLVDLCMMHDPQYIYCPVCDIVTTKVTKHCRLCGQCCLHMDHHCLFLLKCVASNNHVLFVWLLIMACVNMCFYCLGFYLYTSAVFPELSYSDLFWRVLHNEAWPFSLLCLNIASFMWTSSLIYQQYSVVIKGCTSYFNEWKARQYPLSVCQSISNFLHFLFRMPLPHMNPHSPLYKSEATPSANIRNIPAISSSKSYLSEVQVI